MPLVPVPDRVVTRAAERTRLAQVRAGLERLREEIDTWQQRRQKTDPLAQYRTQLATLSAVLGGALTGLHEALQKIAPASPPGAVAKACRGLEARAAWVRLLWRFYAERFNQRDDPALRPLLSAADEMVWSCLQPAENGGRRRAAPLPYLASIASPRTVPREDRPAELRDSGIIEFVEKHLGELPIPLVALPPQCVQEPWLLAHVAHEIGHQVQHDLAPGKAALLAFADALRVATGGSDAWGAWNQEVFADAWAAGCLGPAAAIALADLELAEPPDLLVHRPLYPPALVRVAFIARLAQALGSDRAQVPLAPFALVPELPDQPLAARAAVQALNAVVTATLAMTLPGDWPDGAGGASALTQRFRRHGEEFGSGGEVAQWTYSLIRGEDPGAPSERRSARLLAAASVQAWNQLRMVEDDVARTTALTHLAQTVPRLITAAREPGTRAAADDVRAVDLITSGKLGASAEGRGRDLAARLLAIEETELPWH